MLKSSSRTRTGSKRPKASGANAAGRTAARKATAKAAITPVTDLVEALVVECRGGLITAMNPAGRALLGYAGKAPLGTPFVSLIADAAAARKLSGSLLALTVGRQPKAMTLLGRSGKAVAVTLRASRLDRGADGRLLVVASPAAASPAGTEGKEIGQAHAVIQAIGAAILGVDSRGLVRLANRAADQLFGIRAGAMLGHPIRDFLPAWAGSGVNGDSALSVPPEILGLARDITAVRPDGGHFPADITVTRADQSPNGGGLYAVIVRDASARKASEDANRSYADRLAQEVEARTAELRTLSKHQQRILEAASDGIVGVGLDGTIQSANRAAADLLNRDIRALTGISLDRAFVFGTGTTVGTTGRPSQIRAQLWNGPFHVALHARLARTDGESFDAEYTIAPITEGRETKGYVVTFRDISERKRAETEMLLSAAVLEHSTEGVLIADSRGRITKTNPAFRRITGYEPQELVGKSIMDVLFAEAKASPGVLNPLRTMTQTEWEQWCKNKSGKRYAARINMSVVRDPEGQVQQYAAIVSDITQRKLDEEKILYQANYDQLTGLANRTLFMDRLTRLVVESKRTKTNVGLMFIDLDGFKAINDTLGHDAGDLLLKGCARRLEKSVRESDTVARLGGDEFTVIMPALDSLDAATVVAGRIIRSLSEPFDLDGRAGHVSASIGISVLPQQAADAPGLLHNADVAMYHAKRSGKAMYKIYTADLEAPPPKGS